jgi:hypothetical protein
MQKYWKGGSGMRQLAVNPGKIRPYFGVYFHDSSSIALLQHQKTLGVNRASQNIGDKNHSFRTMPMRKLLTYQNK